MIDDNNTEELEPFAIVKNMSRAKRRYVASCLKKKRANYWSGYKKTEAQLSKLINTPTPCSCEMCGNPRKFWGELTMQEKKHLELMNKAVDELYEHWGEW